jgi:mycothiol synthase
LPGPYATVDNRAVLRAPKADDAPAVLAVLVARDLADLGAPDFTLEDLHDQWNASEFELTSDAVVVELEDGRIAAYATVNRDGARVAVAPEHERCGIGARLLQWTEQSQRERGREQHRQVIAAGNGPARELLRSAGYVRGRSYYRMVRRFDQSLPEFDAVEPPGAITAGIRTRPPDLDRDAAALHALDAASFAAVPDYTPESLTAFTDEHLRAHDLDRELSSVAESRDEIVGFLLARRWRDEAVGYVDLLGVHPGHQRRGLGSALLQEAFRRFAAAGLLETQLGVASDNPRALVLYERAGMTPRFRFDTYERSAR